MAMCLIRVKQEASGKELKLFRKLSIYANVETCTHVGGTRYLQATEKFIHSWKMKPSKKSTRGEQIYIRVLNKLAQRTNVCRL
jgi:hypothetical protein